MKSLFKLLFFLFCSIASFAQSKPGKVSGMVTDTRQKPLEAVTVQLLKHSDTSLVKVAVTNNLGKFTIENIGEGKYVVSVTAVSFKSKTSDAFEITAAKPAAEIAGLQLETGGKSLSEVIVSGKRPYIEQKPDRTILNVDASPSNAGATALEVLEKSPGVTVDNDGNISLKGRQGVIVMMDGKPTYLSSADLANVLRNLPASALDQIEIMTNPSSKYDAAGNSGIINIKTKKSQNNGANGSITLGNTNALFRYKGKEDIFWMPTMSVNVNYRKNKTNLFGNIVYNHREGKGLLDLRRRVYMNDRPSDTLQLVNTLFNFTGNNYTAKMGMDYTASKKNVFGIVLNAFMFSGRPKPTTSTTFANTKGEVFSRINSVTTNQIDWNNFSTNLNYKHTYDSSGRELTADIDYALYKNVNEQFLSTGFFTADHQPTSDSLYLKGHLPSDIHIYSFKSDYVHSLKKGFKIEAGIKSSLVKSDNLVDYKRSYRNEWFPDSRNNHFVYDENINAVYINTSRELKKWSLQTGLRMENTSSKGFQVSNNSSIVRHYTNLFPSAFINRKLDSSNQLTVSFSRRIQRPNYQDLNPFTFFLDSLSFREGNPNLTPQFSYNYELIHTWKGKITTTFNHTSTTDVISYINKQRKGSKDEIITFLTVDNIAKLNNMGIAISAPLKVNKWWNTTLYGNVYRNQYEGTYVATESGAQKVYDLDLAFTSFTLNVTNNFTLPKGWSAELSGWYRYKTIEQLTLSLPMGQLNMALAKNNLFKGKGSLRLIARDPFNWQYWRGRVLYGNIDISIRNRWPNRQYGVSFTYRFGKAQNNAPAKRKTGSSQDEQKRVGAGQQ